MSTEKDNIVEEEVEIKEDDISKARAGILTFMIQIKELVSEASVSSELQVSLPLLLDELKSTMERGRISAYEDLLEITSYLSVIKDAVKANDESEIKDEMASLNKIFDQIKSRHWYVVNTYSGHENRVKENLERRIETMGIEDALYQILVAEEEEVEIRNDKKVVKMKNLYPGYLFVEMIMTDEAWYVVRNTPGVTGFIGSSGGGAKPFPVSDEEIESILRRIGMTDTKVIANFEVGEIVKILNGPFRGIEGSVESMNDETSKAVILTIMFGRETSTEVDYLDLQKVE